MISFMDLTTINIKTYVQHKKIALIISLLQEFTLVTKNRQEEPSYKNDTNRRILTVERF